MAFVIDKINWDKIKSFLGNALFGAIFISFVGFSWWGWVLESTANQKATQMSKEAVIISLAKICVYQASKDSKKEIKVNKMIGQSSWIRGDYVIDQGWSKITGEEEPENGVADKCAEMLVKNSQKNK